MKSKHTLLTIALAFVIGAFASVGIVTGQSNPNTIEVTAKRFAYAPAEITVKKGVPVVLVIKSVDVAHGLRFRELNLDAKISKGGTAEMRFTPEKTGDFVGHCSVFCGSGHGSMTLTLHVVD
jgi:cytochrome c oxidase subunit 2